MLYSPLIFCFENTENFTPLRWLCVLVHRRRELAVLSVFSLNAEIGCRHRATQWFTLLTLRINHVRAIKETVGLVLGCFMLTAVHNTLSWMHAEDIIMCHNHKRNKNREFSVQRQQPQILIFHPEKQGLAPDWATKPFTCFFPSANQHITHKAPLKTSIKWLIITNLWIAGQPYSFWTYILCYALELQHLEISVSVGGLSCIDFWFWVEGSTYKSFQEKKEEQANSCFLKPPLVFCILPGLYRMD